MEILPAIDLRGGRCVRLRQGDYASQTVFGDDPVVVARHWESLGATRLHVVDLDGAKDGRPSQLHTVAAIVRAVRIPVQLGGGIRSEEVAWEVLDAGVDRIILGTMALNRALTARLVDTLGDRLIGGIDAVHGKVAVQGWRQMTEVHAADLARQLADLGLRWIVFTDITRDGMLKGTNVAAIHEMVEAVPEVRVIASGGVSSVEDIRALKEAGAAAAIIGMALYTGKLKLEDALKAAE